MFNTYIATAVFNIANIELYQGDQI